METFWFAVLAFMLVMYVVLDGFDLGAGVLHLFVARDAQERRTIIGAIGPVWDGNEVWLLASGGILFFAFPRVYASSFSGLYLPLMMVLWLLMLRALGIELRSQVDHPLWRRFWDTAFGAASALLAVFFGAALGNVVRGVPLSEEGTFFEPLWTTWTVTETPGILDGFTVLMGGVALSTLTAHGANFLAMKTEGPLQGRARRAGRIAAALTAVTSVGAYAGTTMVRPDLWANYANHPWGLVFPVLGIAGLAGAVVFSQRGQDARAFLATSAFIAGMGSATAFALYPALLPSVAAGGKSLTVWNSAAGAHGLRVGVAWWTVGILLTGGYFTVLYRTFRGKVDLSQASGH